MTPSRARSHSSAKQFALLKGDALGERSRRDYGCSREPGSGWMMPKVLPSVSFA